MNLGILLLMWLMDDYCRLCAVGFSRVFYLDIPGPVLLSPVEIFLPKLQLYVWSRRESNPISWDLCLNRWATTLLIIRRIIIRRKYQKIYHWLKLDGNRSSSSRFKLRPKNNFKRYKLKNKLIDLILIKQGKRGKAEYNFIPKSKFVSVFPLCSFNLYIYVHCTGCHLNELARWKCSHFFTDCF